MWDPLVYVVFGTAEYTTKQLFVLDSDPPLNVIGLKIAASDCKLQGAGGQGPGKTRHMRGYQ